MFKIKSCKSWCIGIIIYLISGCTIYPPVEEYVLAKAAKEAAYNIEAAKYASGNWHRAEEYYRLGKVNFKKSNYKKAKMFFLKARYFAEKAENIVRIVRFKKGESF